MTCDWLRFNFLLTLHGSGHVDEIWYFSGNMDDKWGSKYSFQECFNPCQSWYNEEDYAFRASVSCHRWSVLMAPPMFCYSFKCQHMSRCLGLGLVAQRGEHNFHSFDYKSAPNGSFHSGFSLVTDQHGHTTVDGTWTTPAIIGLSGDDQWDVLRQYSDYYFTSGIAKTNPQKQPPRFWHGPFVCGWIEQIARSQNTDIADTDMATQDTYEKIVDEIHQYGLHPSALIIDDKWQEHYATDEVDQKKWPDLRGFIDARHAEGINTMLWFKMWDSDGWDKSLCVTDENGDVRIDPSHPKFLENIDSVMHRLLSSDEGCYDCDGFKLDFALFNPIGRNFRTYSGKYGVELLYEMQSYIYHAAKKIKPHALINSSPCHPYFAHICDQARLHDYDYRNRNNKEDMTMRAKLFSIAMPGVLVDTDNAGFAHYEDTVHWLLYQHLVGVPDLYSLIGTENCPMDEADYAAISQMWDEYNRRIDAMYQG